MKPCPFCGELTDRAEYRVICPYTDLHPLVRKSLEPYNAEFIKMEDDEHYWRLLCDVWARMETVVMIEHDVLVWPGAIEELLSCPVHWCTFTYRLRGYATGEFGYGMHHTLGCAKFGPKLYAALPDLWQNVYSTKWNHLDAQLYERALQKGIVAHPHRPSVIHLHDYETNAPKE